MGNDQAERISALSDAVEEYFVQQGIDADANAGAKVLRRAVQAWAKTNAIDYDIFDLAAAQIPLDDAQQESLINVLFSIADFSAAGIEDEDNSEGKDNDSSDDDESDDDSDDDGDSDISSASSRGKAKKQAQAPTDTNLEAINLLRRDLASPECTPLTRKESAELGKQVMAAREAREILETEKDLPPEEVEQLHAMIKAGDKASERMVKGALRYGFIVARKFYDAITQRGGSINKGEYPFSEAMGQANLGIMEALNHFDATRGVAFQRYCAFWIRKYMIVGVNETLTIHIPAQIYGDYQKIKQAITLIEADEPKPASVEEIAKMTGLSIKRVIAVTQQMKVLTVVRIDDIYVRDQSTFDGEKPESIETVHELSTTDTLFGDETIPEHVEQWIEIMRKHLDPIEAKAVILNFGFEDGQARTYDEIGKLFGYTKQNIRKIVAAALTKLSAVKAKELATRRTPAATAKS